MVKLHQLDADVLVGHNISGFDLDILLHRLQVPTLIAIPMEFVDYLSMSLRTVDGAYHRTISEAWVVIFILSGQQSGKQHVVENRKTETLYNASTQRRRFNIWLWCKSRSPNMHSWPSPL